MVARISNPSTCEAEAEGSPWAQAFLIYLESSRIAWAIQWDLVSKENNNNNNKAMTIKQRLKLILY